MKAIELLLYFDDYERCSFNGTVVSFTDTDGHTLSLQAKCDTLAPATIHFFLIKKGA